MKIYYKMNLEKYLFKNLIIIDQGQASKFKLNCNKDWNKYSLIILKITTFKTFAGWEKDLIKIN